MIICAQTGTKNGQGLEFGLESSALMGYYLNADAQVVHEVVVHEKEIVKKE